MQDLLEDLNEGFRGEILTQEPMSRHTSWKLGGAAELFLVPQNRADLQFALRCIRRRKLPWLVIGNGSNLLVSDQGVAGVVIQLGRLTRVDFLPGGQVEVEAGVQLGQLIKACCRQGLGGLEELSGIPGMVGGALLMNAGALGTEISQRVSQIFMTDGQGEWSLRREQVDFAYRHSGLDGQGVISGALLQLNETDPGALEERRGGVLARRQVVQKVMGAHAGSVFKNPAGERAWQLIKRAGLPGRRIGNAEVSVEHCNHIVNLGGGRSADVLALIKEVQQAVLQTSGRQLELEVRLVGFEVAEH